MVPLAGLSCGAPVPKGGGGGHDPCDPDPPLIGPAVFDIDIETGCAYTVVGTVMFYK